MKNWCFSIFFVLLLLSSIGARATHIVGGEVTYKFLGTTLGRYNYQISLTIYEDCKNGQPQAIQADTPAFLGVYELVNGNRVDGNTNLFPDAALSGMVPVNFSNACVSKIPDVCLLRKTFITTFSLPASPKGYVIAYQRCCRNGAVGNIVDPGSNGATYYCVIPPTSLVTYNNSAIFTNFPPQIICLNNPLFYDHSATDADGDSLSYGFCSAVVGATTDSVKPVQVPPQFLTPPYYDTVQYVNPPFSAQRPVTGAPVIQIDPVTGIISGTPNRIGRFLVTVCCYEWRHGVLINKISREFQFVVTDCSKVVVASIPQYSTDVNTYVVQCKSFTVNFVNQSSGGFAYHWDFGVPGVPGDTSDAFQPSFVYPDTGTFLVKLVVNPSSTCPDSISRFVKLYPYFKAAYSDSGTACPGMPIFFKDLSSATIKPIIDWTWNFGDGTMSTDQNPQHTYIYGDTYNVMLISENIKHCIDTFVRQVLVENFKPFAGNDTIIVKGESVQFNAVGGTQYLWTPATNLSDPNINNPVGFYPDTGTYVYFVHVVSAYGCEGYDTIKVWVVNQASFFVPTAFSPNGDGKNDVFRPVAVGYRSLNYFRIYDRWGEEVYLSRDITEGWDGTFNHKAAELGTYFWQISFVDRFGKESYLKGDVTLVR